jgi:hypothetical protein
MNEVRAAVEDLHDQVRKKQEVVLQNERKLSDARASLNESKAALAMTQKMLNECERNVDFARFI